MKFTRLIGLLAIVAMPASFFSCQKENKNQSSQIPNGSGSGSVTGVITDVKNIPLGNATVTGGTATATTDMYGKFALSKVQFTSDTVVVNVTKDGFFQGSKNFGSVSHTVSDAKIQLIPKPASVTIAASSGGIVAVSGGGSVNFTLGFVNAANGNAFTGNVSVSAFYINPTDPNFSASMPGNLKGANVANQQGVLQSFGVLALEMNDASGNRLQLAPGKTATISLPIPASLLTSAPLSLPLWYFDDMTGWWKQEGTASRQGNSYVGSVKHFSFWNAGDVAGAGSLNLKVNVTIDTGIVYRNKLVTITRPDSTSTSAYTDNAGTINTIVPVNAILALKVFNDCGKNVLAKNIGPFSGDTTVNVNVIRDDCVSTDTTQFIRMNIKGTTYSWPSSRIRQSYQPGLSTFIMGGNPYDTTVAETVFEGTIFTANTAPGTYPIGIYTVVNKSTYQAGGQAFDPNYPYPPTVITKYDAVGGYIEGSFSGWIKTFPSTATADSFPLSGSYRVKRVQ